MKNLRMQGKQENRRPFQGAIDRLSHGKIVGWYAAPDNAIQNTLLLSIDDEPIGVYLADRYRTDLAALNLRGGRGGFEIPLCKELLDDKSHIVSLHDPVSKRTVVSLPLTLSKPESLRRIEDSIIAVMPTKPLGQQTKVALYAVYVCNETLHAYHRKTIAALQAAGYYVVLIVALDECGVHVASHLYSCEADLVITRINRGYDFASWATGIALLRGQLLKVEHLLILNDSIIGPFSDLGPMVKRFEQSKLDLWGICDSYDHKYHFQSFFFGISTALLASAELDAFFLYTDFVQDKAEAITIFELRMLEQFSKLGFKTGVMLEYRQLARDFISHVSKGLWSNSGKSSDAVSALRLFHGRPITINSENFLGNVISHMENGVALNPSHYFWREILKRGFPFIKKELLTKNPEKNPMLLYAMTDLQEDVGNLALIDDVLARTPGSKFPAFL